MTDSETPIDLTKRTEPLGLSEISRAFRLGRTAAQRWHLPQKQKLAGGKPLREVPLLHEIAEKIGVELDPEMVGGSRPRYPVEVVLALGKALGYLDSKGKYVEEQEGTSRRWLPKHPTIDPETGRRRVYINHLTKALGVSDSAIPTALHRGSFPQPDGTDEMSRIFWWVPTANKELKKRNCSERF
uniref:Uncharacterized protein n=1 Tax=Streptomyces sp. F12 TaxID=1436084 RepID=V9Z3Z4_9ACTN|nr:hypothetical protein [Streptomyces sp. F12]AHE40210.1 hypothetical protein pFRL6_123c [Streptomyces sp. F12]